MRDGRAFAQGSAQAKGSAPRPQGRNPDPRIRAKAARNRYRDEAREIAQQFLADKVSDATLLSYKVYWKHGACRLK